MSKTVIKVENLYKEYKLGVISHGTLYRDIQSWWAKIRGKEDPNSLISSHHGQEADKESFLALNGVSFEVKEGDRLGIIGKNGAGKSTLLKILSQITSPSKGTITIHGKVGSLLEVGTGFHSELTGRENIFLNGSILGMNRHVISRKLDEIVDFAGIEKHLDTPVKRYSSGMMVRLGFAVAAHLDTDILIADEVLAVGDAEFQKKALDKMGDLSTGQGRTVLFVSHNMLAVKNLCSYGLVLQKGKIQFNGNIDEATSTYLSSKIEEGIKNNYWDFENAPGTEKIKVKSAYIQFEKEKLTVKTPFDIVTEFWCLEEGFPINVSMILYDIENACIFNIATDNHPLSKGLHKAIFHIPANLMNDGTYYVSNMFVTASSCYFLHEYANSFEIDEERTSSGWHGKWIGAVRPSFISHSIE